MDTLEALRLYVAIAETGSLSAAARQVSVSTSTVTVALQQLEEQARVSLITRSTRKLSFTFEGRRFLADARKLLADWDASIAGVQDGPLRGPIRMTATQDFGRTVVAPLIDRFLDLHPAVQITLHLSDGVVDLVEQDFDLALRNGPLADSALKARLMLRGGRRVVCAAPSYWANHAAPNHPDDLAAHNCLVHSRPGSTFSSWSFTVEGRPVTVRVAGNRVANDGGVLRQWALDGHGVIMRNAWDIRKELASGALVTALETFVTSTANLYAVTAGGVSSQRVRTFIDFLAENLVAD
ncbi:transcriptional regulator, LysR family [Burkholderia sp. D7]|nr:transcriptional regulator, LysR family [Burkholderia sp. D7]